MTSLNVAFAASTNTTINDGTLVANQISVGVTNLVITNWPPNTTLWLVWQATTLGTAQDVAIDNVSFSASSGGVSPVLPINITPGSVHVTGSGAAAVASFSFTNAAGVSFTVLGTTNLALPVAQWQNLGHPTESPAGSYQFSDPNAATNAAKFYLLRQP